jgi:membrane-associated HD superfamily phosphohydrolase
MVSFCTRNHPWATFGNDMLLGIKADLKTDMKQQEFLPENLLYDFDRAQIYANGNYRQLVSERRMAVMPGVQIIESDFPLTPMQCACILLVITVGISLFDWKRKKRSTWYDVVLLLMQGLAGCVLFVMLFSQHPATSTNLQILLLNPIALGFIPAVIRKKNKTWPKIQIAMIVLFLIGSIFQHYAEGMLIVALCLLLRVIRFEK